MIVGIPLSGTIIFKSTQYWNSAIPSRDRTFTDDDKLLKFAKNINSQFKNRYSFRDYQDNKVWHIVPLKDEINIEEYNDLVEKKVVLEQIEVLFQNTSTVNTGRLS